MGIFKSMSGSSSSASDIVLGWRAGIVESLVLVYATMANKMFRAGQKGNMTKNQAMNMPPPQTARDYYYEARGAVNLFFNICNRYDIPLKVSPEQAAEWFWDSDLTVEEQKKMRDMWMQQINEKNIMPR